MEASHADHDRRAMVRPDDLTAVPELLKRQDQWVVWKYVLQGERWRKVPYSASGHYRASTTNPGHWSTFDVACQAYREGGYSGIGFVFTEGDDLVGIDLDDCIDDDGQVVPEAREIIESLNSYAEVSPSGRGVKVFVCGRKPEDVRCKTTSVKDFTAIEVYEHGRYFTVTGQWLDWTPAEVEQRDAEIHALCERLWPATQATQHLLTPGPDDMDDDELLDRARRAKNGAEFDRLFRGDTSMHDGDRSAADLALCNFLVYWTNGDADRTDRLFRKSGLMRAKWDERRGERTYGEMTIEKALLSHPSCVAPSTRDAKRKMDLVGPVGIRLVPLAVRKTETRLTATFQVHVDGTDTGRELQASNTNGGRKDAVKELQAVVSLVRGVASVERDDAMAISNWVATVLTTDRLSEIRASIEELRCDPSSELIPSSPAMLDIVIEQVQAAFAFGFINDRGEFWSESHERFITQRQVKEWTPRGLLEAISAARDYPEPTANDPTKPIRHLQRTLGAAWSTMAKDMPTEARAEDLGPDTKAARRFRRLLIDLWTKPETWVKREATATEPGYAERVTLLGRVRSLVANAGGPTAWKRVLEGVDAFYRVEVDRESGKLVCLLGMRYTLCRKQIKGAAIPGVGSQADLTALVKRYGLGDEADVTDRVRDGESQQRLVVLSRHVLNGIRGEPVDETALDRVTDPGGRRVTALKRHGESAISKRESNHG